MLTIQPPYHIEFLDLLQIQVLGTLLDLPIDGFYLVEPDGQVALGPAYGRVDITGVTVDQAQEKITRYLATKLPKKPDVQVQWARRQRSLPGAVFPRVPYTIKPGDILFAHVLGTILDQPINDLYTIEPTGTIPLGPAYGRAQVQGLTLEEAERAIREKLEQVLTKPDIQITFPLFSQSSEANAFTQTPEVHWREVPFPTTSYRIKPGDLLCISALGTILDQPIDGNYLVEPAGTVALGPAYGRAKVEGLTLEEAREAIQKKLQEVLAGPVVQVTFGNRMRRSPFVVPFRDVSSEARSPAGAAGHQNSCAASRKEKDRQSN